MDGEFACPECGQIVKVPQQGPGRQVRCTFCNRLLEAPFLPRLDGDWKRTRFSRPRWVVWAWWGIALTLMIVIGFGGVQILVRGERVARAKAIERLLNSSSQHETEGRLDLALLDLDSALEAAPAAEVPLLNTDALRTRRGDLARRDVQDVLARLLNRDETTRSIGDWLNIVARVGSDRDLAVLRRDVEARFLDVVVSWIDDKIALADSKADHDPVAALADCQAGADLAVHLPQPHQDAALNRLQETVTRLIQRRGIVITAQPGEYVQGSPETHRRDFDSVANDALQAHGFLPTPKSSRWSRLWSSPPYRFTYTIRERHEGNYLGTQNRLTRIEVGLAISAHDQVIWKTTPQARTQVPIPNLSSYLAGRLALEDARSDVAEKILYDNAYTQLRNRFEHSLNTLPTASDLEARDGR